MLFAFLISGIFYGQTPIITAIVDGDCSGGTPKLVEIYADGVVDFSLYSLENQTNANTAWGSAQDLTSLGTITDDFVYITASADFTYLDSEFPSVSSGNILVSSTVNINGDDRIRIVETATTSVVDQYGVDSVDGTGEAWDYTDSYAKRIDGTGPDGGFILANWSFGGAAAFDGGGTCQGGSTFASMMGGIGTYSTTGSVDPSLTIISPNNNAVFVPGTTSVTLSINVQNFVVANGTGDGHIHWTIDDGGGPVDQPMKYDTNDESISVTNGGTYTVYMELVDNAHLPISPAVNTTVSFSVANIIPVGGISAVIADVNTNGAGSYYEIIGPSLVTHTDPYQNRKWIQDATISGILIYDSAGTITTTYNVGDMVSGLTGYTQISNGVLRFIPTSDSGTIDSTGNAVVPQVVTITDLNSNPDMYESELIELQNVSFVDGDGINTFSTGTNYNVTDGSNTIIKRTDFFGADYIGELIPSGSINLVAVSGEYNGTAQIYVRSLSDLTLSSRDFDMTNFNLFPNPTSTGLVTIKNTNNAPMNVKVFDILGKQVKNETINSILNVSGLKSGIYILNISQEGHTVTKKLVIE